MVLLERESFSVIMLEVLGQLFQRECIRVFGLNELCDGLLVVEALCVEVLGVLFDVLFLLVLIIIENLTRLTLWFFLDQRKVDFHLLLYFILIWDAFTFEHQVVVDLVHVDEKHRKFQS